MYRKAKFYFQLMWNVWAIKAEFAPTKLQGIFQKLGKQKT